MRSDPARSRVLVTGAAGFVGAVVTRRLLDLGHRVLAVDAGDEPRHHRARAALVEADWVHADLLTIDLVELLDGVDAVVHLAGRPGVQTSWGHGFDDHLAGNPLLTQRLLEAALVTRPRRLVVASSSSVYGDIPDGLAAEDHPLRPLSPYGVSKLAVEALLHAYVARGVDAVALRFFTVFGRGQRPDMALHRMIDAALGGPPFPMRGDGRQARDITHVDDVAAAIVAALSAPIRPRTAVNVGAGRPVSVTDLIERVEAHLLCSVPIVPLTEASGDPSRTAADTRLARRLLGWAPRVGLAEGIADQIEHHVRGDAMFLPTTRADR